MKTFIVRGAWLGGASKAIEWSFTGPGKGTWISSCSSASERSATLDAPVSTGPSASAFALLSTDAFVDSTARGSTASDILPE